MGPVGRAEWPDVVEMIGSYRRFYGAGEPDRERKRSLLRAVSFAE